MSKIIIFPIMLPVLFMSLFSSASLLAQVARDTSIAYKKANPSKIEGYIVLLRLRYDLYGKWKDSGKWPEDQLANDALKGHGEYWAEQLKKGKVLMTGGMKGDYWDNVAIILLEVESEDEAKRLVANDPAVKAYVFQAQVRPFDVNAISDKHTVNAHER